MEGPQFRKRTFVEDVDANPTSKRSKTNGILSFSDLLAEAGCHVIPSRDRLSSSGDYAYEVEDPRKLRLKLEQTLTLNIAQREAFLEGVRHHLDPPATLRAALRPMHVIGAMAFYTGDSFVRALLNTLPLQKDLAEYLLQRIPEFSTAEDGDTTNFAASTAQLILGQFRWLDCLEDAHAVTAALLEVLPVMPSEAQRDAIAFLPEIACEESQEAVLEAFESLISDNAEFLVPILDAATNLDLSEASWLRITKMAGDRLGAVPVDDLPTIVRHSIQHGMLTKDSQAFDKVRSQLHFVSPTDPRLTVPDRKQKGKVPLPGDEPAARIFLAMRQAMQFGKGVPEVVAEALCAIKEPGNHRTFDFWALLALASCGGIHRSDAVRILRNKFTQQHATPDWMDRAVSKHASALNSGFPALLYISQELLTGETSGTVGDAGASLYVSLFAEFEDPYCRQEILRALHVHLGAALSSSSSWSRKESSAALGVLHRLATHKTMELLQYAAFLINILDHVYAYDDEQLRSTFEMFAELIAGGCMLRPAIDGDGETSHPNSNNKVTTALDASRMEDELFIFLRKALTGASCELKRVGAVGIVALARRLGTSLEMEGAATLEDNTPLGRRYSDLCTLLEGVFSSRGAGGYQDTLGFVCEAIATEAQRRSLPKTLATTVKDHMMRYLETECMVGVEEWIAFAAADNNNSEVGRAAWWNLNGSHGDVAVSLLPKRSNTHVDKDTVVTMFPALRAAAAITIAESGNLDALDGLLGAPLGLFLEENTKPEVFQSLPVAEKHTVLLGLFFALNWCRELVNTFAPSAAIAAAKAVTMDTARQIGPASGKATMFRQMQMTLLARLRSAAQLEAVLAMLLPLGGQPAVTLPSLSTLSLGSHAKTMGVGPSKTAPARRKPLGMHRKVRTNSDLAADDHAAGGVDFQDDDGTAMERKTSSGDWSKPSASRASDSGMRASRHNASFVGAAAHVNDTVLPPMERAKLRSLLPCSLDALVAAAAFPENTPCYAVLPCVDYLLSDIIGQVKASLNQPKRLPFHRSTTNPPCGPNACNASQMASAVCPVLPSLRRILDLARDVVDSSVTDDAMAEADHASLKDFALVGPQELLPILPTMLTAARASVSPRFAAHNVISLALEFVLTVLESSHILGPDHRHLLQYALAAFTIDPSSTKAPWAGYGASQSIEASSSSFRAISVSTEGGSSRRLMDVCFDAFKYFLHLAPNGTLDGDEESTQTDDTPTEVEMMRWPAVLAVLEAILKTSETLADEFGGESSWKKRLTCMRSNVCRSASLLLRQRWTPYTMNAKELQGAKQDVRAAGWKGQKVMLTHAIRLSICYSQDPIATIQEYVEKGMLVVDPARTGKAAAVTLDELPSMSGVTVLTWYKTCWEALLWRWRQVTMTAASLALPKSKSGSGRALSSSKERLLNDEFMNLPETMHRVVTDAGGCCSAFADLVAVIQRHDNRSAMHVAAAKNSVVFLDCMVRTLPYFTILFEALGGTLVALLKSAQRGTRPLHTLCTEAKTRRDVALAAKVPALKRAIERFMLGAVTLLQAAGDRCLRVELGELKHRDLQGNEIDSSQLYPIGNMSEGDQLEEEEDQEEGAGSDEAERGES